MTVTVTELREHIGSFGILKKKTTPDSYGKTLPGHLKDMDTRGTVWFVDNDGFGSAIRATAIESFEPQEFKPLPDKYKGKELVDIGGQIVFKGTAIECNVRK